MRVRDEKKRIYKRRNKRVFFSVVVVVGCFYLLAFDSVGRCHRVARFVIKSVSVSMSAKVANAAVDDYCYFNADLRVSHKYVDICK